MLIVFKQKKPWTLIFRAKKIMSTTAFLIRLKKVYQFIERDFFFYYYVLRVTVWHKYRLDNVSNGSFISDVEKDHMGLLSYWKQSPRHKYYFIGLGKISKGIWMFRIWLGHCHVMQYYHRYYADIDILKSFRWNDCNCGVTQFSGKLEEELSLSRWLFWCL